MKKKKEVQAENGVMVQEGKTPSEMIRFAIEHGADLEKLEKLLALKERWEANEARKAYHEAMAEFKKNAPKIIRDQKADFELKAGGRTRYTYASLSKITEKISPKLSKYGLSAAWFPDTKNGISVTTRVTHVKGHSEETTLTAQADTTGSKNAIQAIGSVVSYLERYGLLAILGLATFEMDDDAKGACQEFISDKELSQLTDMIDEYNVDLPAFLKFMDIESLAKMPKKKLTQAFSALKVKAQQVKK